ncbi:hypothetical protein FRC07_004730 [Ceratobasidium sp. 392]|nr:hypothetical protein FRC07_004730 [Ceratobasidium sp. 392]
MSRASTPLSSSSTLTNPTSEPSSPKIKANSQGPDGSISPLTPAGTALTGPAAHTIEALAARHSGTIVVFDLAEQAGFGERAAQWANEKESAKLVHAQTRAGAGLGLAGRLSEGTSADGARPAGGVITAFTTPEGLAQMVPALSTLPAPSSTGRLVIQVAAASPSSTLELTPTLAPAARALASLGPDFTVLVSSTAQEASDFAALSYSISSHVVHVFDHAGATRETAKTIFPKVTGTTLPFEEAVKAVNTELFSYAGDANAETSLVLLNGPLAALARLLAVHTPGLGVVSVRTIRPWNAEALRSALPESVKKTLVIEELPHHSGSGPLFGDVLTSGLTGVHVRGHRVYPKQSHTFHTSTNAFAEFVAEITSLASGIPDGVKYKSLAFLSTPATSSLVHLPQITAHTFLTQASPISARLLSTYDAFASSQGANIARLVLSPSNDPHLSNAPISAIAKRFLVTCTVNKRLTPTTYDRNVFHLEFDTAGTGLKYAIGEALGVHGWNDETEVSEFCEWYGIDPKSAITLPVPGQPDQSHTRTAFHALQQQIDIFGRPPKSFYGALAEYASERADAMALRFIAAPEGAATFKKLAENDTVTFADVLKQFPSARPPLSELATIVGDIKPRHYSIASAQSAVGDRVDLLVVTVDWVTPSGSPRYGQCTRYLAELKIGQKVTVSIKPSVMKLPPDDMQPIIMAGLGTGAAPFRAFIQHRAYLVSQGKSVGPLIYYFGSRHRSQEYLYGEELEAYIADGIVTHTGLAFSRDTNKKIYIQHKMREDGEMLSRMLAGPDNGVFYLCGPTWPVPDVYVALIDALVQYGGKGKEEAAQYLEDLKEEERYVLEVY